MGEFEQPSYSCNILVRTGLRSRISIYSREIRKQINLTTLGRIRESHFLGEIWSLKSTWARTFNLSNINQSVLCPYRYGGMEDRKLRTTGFTTTVGLKREYICKLLLYIPLLLKVAINSYALIIVSILESTLRNTWEMWFKVFFNLIVLFLSIPIARCAININHATCTYQFQAVGLAFQEVLDMANWAYHRISDFRTGSLNLRDMRVTYDTFYTYFGSDSSSNMGQSAQRLLGKSS